MSQQKKKIIKDESNQSTLENFIITKELSTPITHRPRSRSVKRKTPPSPLSSSKDIRIEKKRIFSPCESSSRMASSLDRKYPKGDDLTLEAVKDLLRPLNKRLNELLSSQNEMKETIGEATTLREENEKLKQRVAKAEIINDQLTQRIVRLENKMLESSVILTGIREGLWEMDDVRKEKIYEVISETVLGHTLEERLNTARVMYIKNSRRIGRYRQMYNRPIVVEFMYKEDADSLLNNRRYWTQRIYIDKEYSKETEDNRKILCPNLKAARRLPKYHKKCRLEGDILMINGSNYTVDMLGKLPQDLHGENIKTYVVPQTISAMAFLARCIHSVTFIKPNSNSRVMNIIVLNR